jgi:hypothetical protein
MEHYMSQGFASYSNISVSALEFNPRSQDLVQKKQEILSAISTHYNATPASVLFIGFSPMILGTACKNISVTGLTEDGKKYLDASGVKYTYIGSDDLGQYNKAFSWVIACDEYFTFAGTEEEQRVNIEAVADLAKDLIVTTLRDYKNQDFKDREFSQPLAVYNHKQSRLFVEHHDYDFNDKNSWTSTVYELEGESAAMYGPFARRSMFFKQMAKFSIDAGAKNFYVHKNLMYKSLIKKNYEHVISISF